MLVTDALKSDHRCIGRMLTIVQKAGNCLDFGQQVSPRFSTTPVISLTTLSTRIIATRRKMPCFQRWRR